MIEAQSTPPPHRPVFVIGGERYVIVERRTVRGCGPKLDGRALFALRRLKDRALFHWMGGRTTRTVPSNARLSRWDGAL